MNGADHQAVNSQPKQTRKYRVKVLFRAGVQYMELHAKQAGSPPLLS